MRAKHAAFMWGYSFEKIGFDLKNLGRKLYQFQDNDQYDKTYMRTLDELAYSQRKICILSARQP